MTLWFTSDLHFGHTNIIRYSDRPFRDVEEMNAALIDTWNTTVAPEDTVVVVGDVVMGKVADTLPLAGQLCGTKILYAGNHDRCASFLGRKAEGWEQAYREIAGFSEIIQGMGRIDLDSRHRKLLIGHFPYRGDSRDAEPDRYAEERPIDNGEWLLHGHVHDLWLQRGRMINLGIDAWGGRLASAGEVADLIDAGVQDRPRIPWVI